MSPASVGVSMPRRDLPEKLTGEAKFTADIRLPGMLHGKILRSRHPHARILAVDASAAARLPGVHAVLTPFDVPDGRVAPDLPILNTKVRYVGDEVAAVAAVDEDTAQEALRLIEVSYEPLPFVTDPVESMFSGPPSWRRGSPRPTESSRRSSPPRRTPARRWNRGSRSPRGMARASRSGSRPAAYTPTA